jgi:transcriptional regulator with XRE-family HTH domain
MNYKKLIDLVSEENLSDNKIARIMDMSGTGYREMLKNQTMKVETLEKVARHFNVPVSYFFDEPATELNEPRPEYKTNCCELCREKDKQIEELKHDKEWLKSQIEVKKETGAANSVQFRQAANE